MNTRQIGRNFEKKAFDYLKNMFDEVDWLSETNKSVFDFRIVREGKFLYGDAKFSKNQDSVYLTPSQRDASFVITNDGEEIMFIEKKDFGGRVKVSENDDKIIKISEKTYLAIRKLGMMGETFDNVLQRIMGLHKKELKEAKQTVKDKEMTNKL